MRSRRLADEFVFILVLAPAVGAVAGLGGVALVHALVWLHHFTFSVLPELVGNRFSVVVLVPLLGALAAGVLVAWLCPEARGGGVVAVIRQMALRGGKIPHRVAPVKLVASALCIGTGGSGGREGPIVQVGAAVGSAVAGLVRLSAARRRLLLACGAAAGIAATFDAPLGGVFFALEVILGHYGARYFSAIVMSSVTSAVITRYFFGRYPAFAVPAYTRVSPGEMPLYLALGLLCSVCAWCYIRSIAWAEKRFARAPLWARPACGALLVGLLGLASLNLISSTRVPPVMGDGFDVINMMLAARLGLWVALGLAALKTAATACTLGSESSAGLYGPSLFVGAAVGCGFGRLVYHFVETSTPAGVFALVGMGAMSAAVAQAPLSSIIMLFELSGHYDVLLPVMAASILSTVVARRFSPNSVFTHTLSEKGIDVWRYRGGDVLGRIPVADAVLVDPPSARPEEPAPQARARLEPFEFTACAVLDENQRLVGLVTQQSLEHAGTVGEVMRRDFLVSWPDETLREAALKLDEVAYDVLPVVERQDPRRLLGLLSSRGILIAYHRMLDEVDTLEGGVRGMRGAAHAVLVGAEGYGIQLPEYDQTPDSAEDHFDHLTGAPGGRSRCSEPNR